MAPLVIVAASAMTAFEKYCGPVGAQVGLWVACFRRKGRAPT